MKLRVNGEERDLSAMRLSELLALLDYEGDWLATAVNGELVPTSERPNFTLSENDSVEILSPMQGG